ncbi:MAG: thiol-disulfide oxidoreductase DCC family protein [Cyclobacteriaceae bacterium]
MFFDGVCNLCNGFVDFILRRDPKGKFRFASLQSAAAEEYLRNHDVTTGNDPDSVVLLTPGDEVYTESTAVLRIAGILGGAWPLMKAFYIFPGWFRDRVYRWVAKNRYSWFGQRDTCRMPTEEERKRFL